MQEPVIVILPIAILVLLWLWFKRVGTPTSSPDRSQEPRLSARWLIAILVLVVTLLVVALRSSSSPGDWQHVECTGCLTLKP